MEYLTIMFFDMGAIAGTYGCLTTVALSYIRIKT